MPKNLRFTTYLIQHIGLDDVEVNTFTVDELGGFNEDSLTKKLKSTLKSAKSKPIEKIGIILDLDLDTKENGGGYVRRLASVNRAIETATSNDIPSIPATNELVLFPVDDKCKCRNSLSFYRC